MAIISVGPNDDPFSRVPKALLNDNRLSWKSKGILSYLLGHPSNWEVRVKDLVHKSSDGVTAVLSALKELREFGYATLKTIRSRDGKFYSKQWTIYRHPQSGFPFTDNPFTGNPFTENPLINKKKRSKNEEKEKQWPSASRKPDNGSSSSRNGESPLKYFSEAINIYHSFAKGRDYHIFERCHDGHIRYIQGCNEGGWNKHALTKWESRYQGLLLRIRDEKRILKTLRWFIANALNDPYLPPCKTFLVFVDKFDQIDNARRRAQKDKAPLNGEHRNGEHKKQSTRRGGDPRGAVISEEDITKMDEWVRTHE